MKPNGIYTRCVRVPAMLLLMMSRFHCMAAHSIQARVSNSDKLEEEAVLTRRPHNKMLSRLRRLRRVRSSCTRTTCVDNGVHGV